jgi:hypothetical protein
MFFFEKKNQKTFPTLTRRINIDAALRRVYARGLFIAPNGLGQVFVERACETP